MLFLFIPSVSSFTTLLFLEYWFSYPLVFHFSPSHGVYNPTALQAHAAPVLSLCFPAFRSCCLTRSFSYLPAFLSVLRAFTLLSSLPSPNSLPGYKKSPPGVSAPGGDPLSLWVWSCLSKTAEYHVHLSKWAWVNAVTDSEYTF